MRGHRSGHNSSVDDTLALLAPTLPIPAGEVVRSVVQAGTAGQPATPVAIGATPTLVLTKTITPEVTGKFVVIVSYKAASDGTAGLTIAPVLEAGNIPIPVYAGPAINLPASVGTFVTDSFEVEVDGQTVGTPTTFELLLQASGAGHLTIVANGASMYLQEQAN